MYSFSTILRQQAVPACYISILSRCTAGALRHPPPQTTLNNQSNKPTDPVLLSTTYIHRLDTALWTDNYEVETSGSNITTISTQRCKKSRRGPCRTESSCGRRDDEAGYYGLGFFPTVNARLIVEEPTMEPAAMVLGLGE